MTDASRRRGRLQLLLIAAIFFAPMLFAWLMYMNADEWRPDGTVNYGQVLLPPTTVALSPQAGEGDFLRGKWTLVTISGADCAADCQQRLEGLRQLRASMGRRIERVQGLYLSTASPTEETQGVLADVHKGLRKEVIDTGHPIYQAMLRHEPNPETAGRTWLIDPLGNLMLAWPVELDLKRVKKDLLRLLKVSSIG